MIEIIKGKKTEEISEDKLHILIEGYDQVIVDIGTGDGKFVYERARKDQNNFYIGIDPNRSELDKYSAKIYKKPSRGGIDNALFVIAYLENLPEELENIADKIYINNPWASLLFFTIKAEPIALDNLKMIAKDEAELEMLFNYSSKYEPQEMKKLNIPDLSKHYIKHKMIPTYAQKDILIEEYKVLTQEEVKEIAASWSRKLIYGRDRTIWQIKATINTDIDQQIIEESSTPKKLKYEFQIKGHKNILADHPKTIEFTKDKTLTTRGDCIVGIKADFELEKLKEFHGWCEMIIKSGEIEQRFKFLVNKDYSSNDEMVFRKSRYNSDRTFGFFLDKGSNKVDRSIIQRLQKGEEASVVIQKKAPKEHINKYKDK